MHAGSLIRQLRLERLYCGDLRLSLRDMDETKQAIS